MLCMLCMQHVRGRVACRGGVLGRANGGLFAPSCGGEQVWERLEEDVVRLDDEDVPLVRCQPRGELPAPQGAGTRVARVCGGITLHVVRACVWQHSPWSRVRVWRYSPRCRARVWRQSP